MAEYQLYCFAQSGNSYRAALMLKLIGADWEPVFVDFFASGVQRTAGYRTDINEMGEAPVLVHGAKKLTQSGVILTYLAERSGKFQPRGEGAPPRSTALDHLRQSEGQRLCRSVPLPAHAGETARPSAVLEFFKGRIDNVLGILEAPRRPRLRVGSEPTIADLSLVGYLYYPPEEFGFDVAANYSTSLPGSAASRRCPAGRIPTS